MLGINTTFFALNQGQTLGWSSDVSTAGDTLLARAAAGVVGPNADGGTSLGNSAKRFLAMSSQTYNIYAAASDSVAAVSLSNPSLQFGPGGSGALDTTISRIATSGWGSLQFNPAGTLTGSPADAHVFDIVPALAGAFTVTRLNYLNCRQPTGAATITDAAVFRFDAAVGTHKALASSAAVGVTIGAGPTGSTAGNPQGWIKINVNGTLRYMPFW